MTDYKKLVAALRCENAQNVAGPDCAEYDCYANRGKGLYCQTAKLLSDAADAIEALQAQLQKRGEWIRIDKHTVQCSLCRMYLDLRGVNAGRGDANYCPNCGAKMTEVQDG